MNGPQHFAEAEQLLRDAADDIGDDLSPGHQIERAQVHATLALAAAVADGRGIHRNYEGQVVGVDPAPGWTEATA